jgi:hypothetical protein
MWALQGRPKTKETVGLSLFTTLEKQAWVRPMDLHGYSMSLYEPG